MKPIRVKQGNRQSSIGQGIGTKGAVASIIEDRQTRFFNKRNYMENSNPNVVQINMRNVPAPATVTKPQSKKLLLVGPNDNVISNQGFQAQYRSDNISPIQTQVNEEVREEEALPLIKKMKNKQNQFDIKYGNKIFKLQPNQVNLVCQGAQPKESMENDIKLVNFSLMGSGFQQKQSVSEKKPKFVPEKSFKDENKFYESRNIQNNDIKVAYTGMRNTPINQFRISRTKHSFVQSVDQNSSQNMVMRVNSHQMHESKKRILSSKGVQPVFTSNSIKQGHSELKPVKLTKIQIQDAQAGGRVTTFDDNSTAENSSGDISGNFQRKDPLVTDHNTDLALVTDVGTDLERGGSKINKIAAMSNQRARSIDIRPLSNNSNTKQMSMNTKKMLDRWQRANQLAIPKLDQQDIIDQGHFMPNLIERPYMLDEIRQPNAEYTDSSYRRLRAQEEALPMDNYLEKAQQMNLLTPEEKQVYKHQVTEMDRCYGIQKIIDLHSKKEYKRETLFISAALFDRFIYSVGVKNFPKQYVLPLATTCVLMGAKLEQPITPCFNRMIRLLTDEEKKHVSRDTLIEMEAQILVTLGFDFNYPGPYQSMERFLRILDYDKNDKIKKTCFQICKYQLNDPNFLKYKSSKIAACSVILAINIFEKDNEHSDRKGYLGTSNFKIKGDVHELVLDFWNTKMVHDLTGYSISDLKECLFDLSLFISTQLSTNMLEGIDFGNIKTIQQIQF